jgi:hypothetical protein
MDESGTTRLVHSLFTTRLFPISVIFAVALSALTADRAFTSYVSAKPVLDQQRGQLPAGLAIADEASWTAWSHREDKAIRGRLQQGDLDSMVDFLLFGVSIHSAAADPGRGNY